MYTLPVGPGEADIDADLGFWTDSTGEGECRYYSDVLVLRHHLGPAGDDWLEQMKKVIELMPVILPSSRGLVVV